MPPLISPSPAILDQSFPKSLDELSAVLLSLGELESLLNEDKIHLFLTNALAEWVLDFEWSPPENCPKLNLIFQFISNLFLSPTNGVVRLSLESIDCKEEECHPLPEQNNNLGWSELWRYEFGKLFKLYKQIKKTNEEFIAIACEYGFSGRTTRIIADEQLEQSFKYVGLKEFIELDDAYYWMTETGILTRNVEFKVAKKNIYKLGATKITNPRSGSSHYPVHFKGERSWPLDSNDDPVPLVYLRQLVQITHYPIEVVVHVLLYNEFPPKQIKIPNCYLA